MELAATYHFPKPPDEVWAALMDPQTLAGCIPGCRSLEPDGADRYRAAVTIRIGPVGGQFAAAVALADLDPPRSYRMSIDGSGSIGFASGTAFVTLTPAGDGGNDGDGGGGTAVSVRAEVQVGGPAARVGQRMIGSVAKGMLDRFFGCLVESV